MFWLMLDAVAESQNKMKTWAPRNLTGQSENQPRRSISTHSGTHLTFQGGRFSQGTVSCGSRGVFIH